MPETALKFFGAVILVPEGLAVGFTVGFAVALAVGLAVGLTVGFTVGFAVGLAVGLTVGEAVGFGVFVAAGAGVELVSSSLLFVYQKLQSTFPVIPLTFPELVYCQYSYLFA